MQSRAQRISAALLLALLVCCAASKAEQASGTPNQVEYFFFNSVSGKSQFEDPGDVPYVDENGNRFWLDEKQEWVNQDANAWRYVWVERWSDEHKRPYFFNQETKQSTWSRPADLAWQRVMITAANAAMVPERPAAPEGGAGAAAAAAAAPGSRETASSSEAVEAREPAATTA